MNNQPNQRVMKPQLTLINAHVRFNQLLRTGVLFLLLFVCLPSHLMAQKGLHIDEAFKRYGKAKNAVMVNMSKEVLEEYDFTFFKSITLKNDPEAAEFIRTCLAKDEKGAKKIKQVVANGVVTTIYLQLAPIEGGNRLILFNEQVKPTRQLVLIYIESEKETDDILKPLLIKKRTN
ncbi:MAG TPA: hypothetical protein DD409_04645 [Bacteroidales bacterium]|jgi:hypothetical protein|nr:hypothetical protein [Bacteroidales bacterium]